MASKYAEKDTVAGRKKAHSDSDDSDEEYTLLYKANKFLGKRLDSMTARFISDYGHEFQSAVEDGEHKLVFTELHSEYVDNFQLLLEEFVLNECSNMNKGVAFRQFFEEAKSSITGQFQPLFEEDDDVNRQFVDSVLAADDYDAFFNMMISACSAKAASPRGK